MGIELKLLLSLVLGAIIGLEREAYVRKADTARENRGSLGVRSYMILSPLGCITALLYPQYAPLAIALCAGFLTLLVCYYILGSIFLRDNGLTTEFAILWSYIVGLLIGLALLPIQVIIAMVIVLTTILSYKQQIRTFVGGIRSHEFEGFLGYALMALVILPFLPNHGYTLREIPFLYDMLRALVNVPDAYANLEIVNPFGLWRVVAIITGVELLGYVLQKVVGKSHGMVLSSLVGGFVSSTSATISLAVQSKKNRNTSLLVGSAVLANMASFLQIVMLIATVNGAFLSRSMGVILALIVSGSIVAYWHIRRSKHNTHINTSADDEQHDKKLFALMPALQFAALFVGIKMLTKIMLLLFGEGGFVVGSMIAATTGLDAVTINIAESVGRAITDSTGMFTLIVANAVNLGAKSVYSYVQGSRAFALNFFVSMCVIAACSLAAYALT